ncbi:MAG TPA: RNA methyltransferase [Ktedonobacteraceae bacterium]|nr:RNA methyltransferase [Ktedonobacteraceae bacterium]
MIRITSVSNPHVTQIRDLHTTRGRKKNGLLLMEGPHLYTALFAANFLPREIYFSPELLQRTPEGRDLLASLLHPAPGLAKIPAIEVSERVAAALSDAQTSQGVVCVVSTELFQAERLQARRTTAPRPALLILDDLADPGNMGTILRTALAADVEEVLLTPHCVDCFSPKVMRAAAGAHVALPIWTDMEWSAIEERTIRHCGSESQRIFSTEASSSIPYYAEDLRNPFALIIGNEAHGLSRQARMLASRAIGIPLANAVESLNAAMAAGIILFEAVRQLHHG